VTTLIDKMAQVAEALKVAGDDIAARTLTNARRDRIRGLVTTAAAEAALGAAERHLAELAKPRPFDLDLLLPAVVLTASQVSPRGFDIMSERKPVAVDPPNSPTGTVTPTDVADARRELGYTRNYSKIYRDKPYPSGGYYGRHLTLEELGGLVATLTRMKAPDDLRVYFRADDGYPGALEVTAVWKVEP